MEETKITGKRRWDKEDEKRREGGVARVEAKKKINCNINIIRTDRNDLQENNCMLDTTINFRKQNNSPGSPCFRG